MSTSSDGTLLARTRKLLQSTDKTYLDIYKATNLNPNWLSLLARGEMPNPSVNKVQALYEHLTAKQLTV